MGALTLGDEDQKAFKKAVESAKQNINDGVDKLDLEKLIVAIDSQREKGDKIVQVLRDLAQQMFMINGNLDALKTRAEQDLAIKSGKSHTDDEEQGKSEVSEDVKDEPTRG